MDAPSETPPSADTAPPGAAAAGRAADRRRAPVIAPALRTWLRYAVPLTLLSALALAPLIAVAMRARVPANAAAARGLVALGWALVALAWLGQLVLVGAAAAMIGERRSQLRALGGGLVQMIRAVVPCAVAAAAVLLGSLALVVPGPVLLVALSLTAASRARGLPAPLLDSIAAVRRQWLAVALAVAAMFALDAAIGAVAHRALVAALSAKPTPPQLAAARDVVRAIAAALVVVSPLPACVLAQLRARAASEPAAFT